MLRLLYRLVWCVAVLLMLWSAIVYGVPWLRGVLPGLCARWELGGGICSTPVFERLERIQRWTEATLLPVSRHARLRRAAQEAVRAVRQIETLVREQVGSERMDAALRGADVALGRLEGLIRGERQAATGKVAAVPENAQELLLKARTAFDRLRQLLQTTGRRREEVSSAVQDAKQALDALSEVLPESKKEEGNGR